MEKSLQEFVTEQTKKVLADGSCCQQLKDVAQAWLDAAGTPGEAEATRFAGGYDAEKAPGLLRQRGVDHRPAGTG